MIEKTEIDGRPCVIVYLDNYLRQVDSPDKADLAMAVFTDEKGGSMFLFNKYMHLGGVPFGIPESGPIRNENICDM
jgi:hypothetical protein